MTNTSNFVTPMVNMFLYPQALWNPQCDLHQSLREYATLYFGDPSLAGYFQELSRGLEEVLQLCHYVHPGDGWDDVRVDREPDEALAYHVRSLKEALAGPLPQAASILDQSVRRATGTRYLHRLRDEQVSMNFTVRQAMLFYHLLQGERFYRIWKSQHRQDAGLNALTELALARYNWESQKKFVATSGMLANPLIPSPRELEARADELAQAITKDPASVAGVNILGFASDPLDEHLMNGVTGYMLAGPTGSTAVLWTDVPAHGAALRRGGDGMVWFDELGQPLRPGGLDLYASPVVVEARGMPVNRLFAALLDRQVKP